MKKLVIANQEGAEGYVFAKTLVRCAAPALCGIKAGNLFSVRQSDFCERDFCDCAAALESFGIQSAFVQGRRQRIVAIFYDADDDGHDFYVSAGLSRAAYARLAIAEILPGDVSRAIYLDGDLIVTDDIKKLFMHDMGDMPIAGTMDLGIMASSKRRREKNIVIGLERNEPYFNSGVLLMDIKKWRDEDYGATLIQDATAHKYPHHDQDVLNKIFMGKWSVLPLRWNVIPPVYQLHMKILLHGGYRAMAMEARERPAIIHYAGGYKPGE